MKKMNRILAGTAMAAVAVGTLVTSNEQVHAATSKTTTNNPTPAKDATVEEQSAAQKQVTAAKSADDQAASDVEKAQTAVSEAKQTVTTADQSVTARQDAVTKSKSDMASTVKAADASQTQINQTKQDLESATTEQASAQKVAATATQADKTVNTAVSQAQSAADTANQAVKSQQTVVDKAQTALDQAEANSAPKTVEEAETKMNTALATMSKADGDATEAQFALSDAQGELDDAQQEYDDTMAWVASQKADAASGSADLPAAQKALTAAKNTNAAAHSTLASTLKSEADAYINLPTSLKQTTLDTKEDADFDAGLQWFKDTLANAVNTDSYTPSAADKAEKITDSANLTTAQQTELTNFAAQVINGMRAQFGSIPVTVTHDSVGFAQQVAKNYDADNWYYKGTGTDAHDIPALNKAAASYGLDETNYSEDGGGTGFIQDYTTMAGLKTGVFSALQAMVYNDAASNWGHAVSIVMDGGNDYLGVSVDKMGQLHFNLLDVDDGQIDTTDINPSSKIKTLTQTAIKSANDLQDAQARVDADNAQIDGGGSMWFETPEEAKQNLADAKTQLASAQKKADDIAAAYQKASDVFTDAQQVYGDFLRGDPSTEDSNSAKLVAKATASLNQAKNTLAILQTAAKNANSDLTTVQSQAKEADAAKTSAYSALKAATAKVKNLQKQLDIANNGDQAIADAKAKLATAKQALVKAQADATAAKTALATANEALTTAQATKSKTTAALSEAQAALKTINDRLALQNSLNVAAAKAVLSEYISDYGQTKATTYTASSYQALQRAVAKAKAVAANDNATQTEVEAAQKAILMASDALEQANQTTTDTNDADNNQGQVDANHSVDKDSADTNRTDDSKTAPVTELTNESDNSATNLSASNVKSDSNKPATPLVTTQTNAKKTPIKQAQPAYPQTGDTATPFGMIGMGVLALTALFGFNMKKRRE